MGVWRQLGTIIAADGVAALVTVLAASGSTPRGQGARMVVRADGALHGSIGGGRLEWEALALARRAMAERRLAAPGEDQARLPRQANFKEQAQFCEQALVFDQALGPDLGQCCGGRVRIMVEIFTPGDVAALTPLACAESGGCFTTETRLTADGRVARRILASPSVPPSSLAAPRSAPLGRRQAHQAWTEEFGETALPLLLFGAGHVGRALVMALAPLPFAVRWVDSRADAFPAYLPANVVAIRAEIPEREMDATPDAAAVLIMTHDHALDLALTAAALARPRLAFVGLIGSASKRGRFVRRLADAGLGEAARQRLVCPIGVPGLAGKEPAIIAASVAVQLLQQRERVAASGSAPRTELQPSAA